MEKFLGIVGEMIHPFVARRGLVYDEDDRVVSTYTYIPENVKRNRTLAAMAIAVIALAFC